MLKLVNYNDTSFVIKYSNLTTTSEVTRILLYKSETCRDNELLKEFTGNELEAFKKGDSILLNFNNFFDKKQEVKIVVKIHRRAKYTIYPTIANIIEDKKDTTKS